MRILLVGAPRSGTTWSARAISRAAGARLVPEPDGPASDILGALVVNRLGAFPILSPGEKSGWYKLVWDVAFSGGWPWGDVEVARATGRKLVKIRPAARDHIVRVLGRSVALLQPRPQHVVVKSVNCMLSLDWIASRYQPRVVLVRRDPLNIVSSWMALDWDPAGAAHAQALAARSRVEGFELSPPSPSASRLARTAWTVGLLLSAMKAAAETHSDWIVVSHDQACLSPRESFQGVYRRLGLEWTAEADAYLTASEDPGFVVYDGNREKHPNVLAHQRDPVLSTVGYASQWQRRFKPGQIDEVLSVLESFRLGEWGPAPAKTDTVPVASTGSSHRTHR